jgi:hypothetical protein
VAVLIAVDDQATAKPRSVLATDFAAVSLTVTTNLPSAIHEVQT